jgi:hypothetical protein
MLRLMRGGERPRPPDCGTGRAPLPATMACPAPDQYGARAALTALRLGTGVDPFTLNCPRAGRPLGDTVQPGARTTAQRPTSPRALGWVSRKPRAPGSHFSRRRPTRKACAPVRPGLGDTPSFPLDRWRSGELSRLAEVRHGREDSCAFSVRGRRVARGQPCASTSFC